MKDLGLGYMKALLTQLRKENVQKLGYFNQYSDTWRTLQQKYIWRRINQAWLFLYIKTNILVFLWASAFSNNTSLSCPTSDLMRQVPYQRQLYTWVLGCFSYLGQQCCVTLWENVPMQECTWYFNQEERIPGNRKKKKTTLQQQRITKYSEENLDPGQQISF